MAGELGTLLGIFPASTDASVTTGVMEVRAVQEDPKGQAQVAERVEQAHSARGFGSVAEVVRTMRTRTGQAVREQ